MIITVSGDLGSGKSTIAKAIAKDLKLKHYSTGDLMRKMAKKRGVTLLELTRLAEKSPDIDKEIDAMSKELAEKEDDFIIDSRLAWYFIPESIKIYLKCDIGEAAKRVFNQKRSTEAENRTVEDTKKNILQREKSEVERYKKYYGIDFKDEENYDFVLDTTDLEIPRAVRQVLDFIEQKQKI